MGTIARVRVSWSSSTVVGGGVSTFFFNDALMATNIAALTSFFTAVKDQHAPGTQWQIPNTGDTIDDSTGALVGTWSGGSSATVTAAGSSSFVQGTGLRIVWHTAGVFHRRRVRGSTFFAPLTSDNFEGNGAITASSLGVFNGAATTFLSAVTPDLVIWSRPGPSHPNDGMSSTVTGGIALDKTSWLRSRRV